MNKVLTKFVGGAAWFSELTLALKAVDVVMATTRRQYSSLHREQGWRTPLEYKHEVTVFNAASPWGRKQSNMG